MNYIKSIVFNILWNGNMTKDFKLTRRLQQSDPLSPYIFGLCLDKLSHMISDAINNKNWIPMKAGKNGPPISHLMFTDDLLLSGEAFERRINVTLESLNNFFQASGQKVNHTKTSIFFSHNVKLELMAKITTKSGFNLTNDLVIYLGIPLVHKKVTKNMYNFLVNKVQEKLTSWKANCFSMAKRVILFKAIISLLPTYSMQVSLILGQTLLEIDKHQRVFIWGHDRNIRKIHIIPQDSLCQPKLCKGLSIRNLQKMNIAFLMKLV